MIPSVDVYIGPAHDLIHTSLVFTGLCALSNEGAIRLRYRRPRGDDEWLVADPMVVCIEIDEGVRIALDLRDGEGTSYPIIDRVDWYLKRAYYPVEIDRLPPETARKFGPFGMNFGCRSLMSTMQALRFIGWPIASQGRAGLQRLRQYFLTPTEPQFEQSAESATGPWVTFQTRLWTADEITPDEVEPLNAGRVAVIRALRKAFGDRFLGGLVPTPFALKNYPDDITPHSSRYSEYLTLRKRCLIGVYTHGVEHSLAFKLGETFAAAQCLVSEPLRYGLPEPLEPGRHYLLFEEPEECVEHCRRLLADAQLAQSMRRANHDYYQREIKPAPHVARVIDRVRTGKVAG